MGAVVIIGTARADESWHKKLMSHIKRMADTATNLGYVHQQMDEASESRADEFSYFRLRAQSKPDVKLDEWQAQSVAKMLRKMHDCLFEWKQQPQNEQLLRDCALGLVQRRTGEDPECGPLGAFRDWRSLQIPFRRCMENDLKGQDTCHDHLPLGRNWDSEVIDDQLEGFCSRIDHHSKLGRVVCRLCKVIVYNQAFSVRTSCTRRTIYSFIEIKGTSIGIESYSVPQFIHVIRFA